jgi:hypothetical protein
MHKGHPRRVDIRQTDARILRRRIRRGRTHLVVKQHRTRLLIAHGVVRSSGYAGPTAGQFTISEAITELLLIVYKLVTKAPPLKTGKLA